MQIFSGQAISKNSRRKTCVCVCLLVQMNDKDIVITLLEKKLSHLFHAHLFLSAIHISLQHVDIAVPCFVADWHPSVCK